MKITYDQISLIGMEMFRKNNSSFISDSLSPIMERIFKAANHIKNIDGEYYMKSGILPNEVFYIYSDQVRKDKLFDTVYFNGSKCTWLYSKNIMNAIDEEPIKTIYMLYSELFLTFAPRDFVHTFLERENKLLKYVMTIRIIVFLHETYGILELDKCRDSLVNNVLKKYTTESALEFVDDVIDNCNDKDYFTARRYLDSYMLLEEYRPCIPLEKVYEIPIDDVELNPDNIKVTESFILEKELLIRKYKEENDSSRE